MTDTTDIKALREQAESIMNLLDNLAGFEPQDIDMDAVELRFEDENGVDTGCDISIVDTAQQSAGIIRALLDHLEAERQQAAEINNINLNIKLSLHERMVKAEKEVIALKRGMQPVGEIVAWSGTNREMGITRDIDFRFFRFDVKPGTKLYSVESAPAVKSNLLTRAEALAVETRALASRIKAEERWQI